MNQVYRESTTPTAQNDWSRQPRQREEVLSYRGLIVDFRAKRCVVDGTAVRLRRKEFEILALLLSDKGRIFSREEIMQRVWQTDVVVLLRTIDVNITRIRQSIGAYSRNVVTRSGYGYGFEEL